MTLSMAFLNTIFLIAATRTNITFVLMFACVISALSCLTGAFWQTSNNNSDLAEILLVAGGGCFFGACACGWWCLASIILAAVDFPYQLPRKCPLNLTYGVFFSNYQQLAIFRVM
jgi:uncharacterized protein